MKELEQHNQISEAQRIEINVKKKQQIEHELQGRLKPKNGQFIWELNEETGEIKKAEFKKQVPVFGAKNIPQEIIINPDCIYIPALNAENAKNKYLKNKEQSHYYAKEAVMQLHKVVRAQKRLPEYLD